MKLTRIRVLVFMLAVAGAVLLTLRVFQLQLANWWGGTLHSFDYFILEPVDFLPDVHWKCYRTRNMTVRCPPDFDPEDSSQKNNDEGAPEPNCGAIDLSFTGAVVDDYLFHFCPEMEICHEIRDGILEISHDEDHICVAGAPPMEHDDGSSLSWSFLRAKSKKGYVDFELSGKNIRERSQKNRGSKSIN